jgi:uncharacterized membrane protein YgdD (TMEM256/DUF423 family)
VQTAPTPVPDHATTATARSGFVVAGVLGALGVALGAFGAHALKGWLATADDGAQRLAWWSTGTQYHLAHALLAVVFAVMMRRAPRARTGLWLCVVGVTLFSGSLYVMTLTNIRALGAVTPLGGLAFIGAWLWLIVATRNDQA